MFLKETVSSFPCFECIRVKHSAKLDSNLLILVGEVTGTTLARGGCGKALADAANCVRCKQAGGCAFSAPLSYTRANDSYFLVKLFVVAWTEFVCFAIILPSM